MIEFANKDFLCELCDKIEGLGTTQLEKITLNSVIRPSWDKRHGFWFTHTYGCKYMVNKIKVLSKYLKS